MASESWDVLVVDDEPVICHAVRMVLGEEGLSVATASDCKSALTHPSTDSCRLVLCDLVLPDGSGLDLIRELRRRRPGLPIVLITGYATPEQESLALQAGATRFMPKPFEDSELLEAVHGALSTAAATVKEKQS
jgi:DNA-binding NtrC family response regulator